LRLVKCRNPWALKEWGGDWSDRSDKWTDELKTLLKFEQRNDGVFFISYNDYLQFFVETVICKYLNDGDLSVIEDEQGTCDFCV